MLIGGSKKEYNRFPFNTLLVTDDLLLHSYHKLFDNALKAYEKKTARPIMSQLSQTLSQKYAELAKKEENSELKEYYEFLSVYWAVPYTLLPSDTEIEQYGEKFESYQENLNFQNGDKEEVQKMIMQRANRVKTSLPKAYQEVFITTIENIFKEKSFVFDALFYQLDQAFFDEKDILQDYSQFTPRSHYTDDVYLSTYFRAMKWFMREKFYFESEKSTKALLVLGATLEEKELEKLNTLSKQIYKLIGQDDDLTTFELMDWLKKKNITSQNVLSKYSDDLVQEISTLHPQKIISTSYFTEEEQTTEEASHTMTDGFVFFGEKFTIDSYAFDLMTAGSAEKEFVEKPNKQTALMIPDLIERNGLAGKMVDLRLNGLKATNESEVLAMAEKSKI